MDDNYWPDGDFWGDDGPPSSSEDDGDQDYSGEDAPSYRDTDEVGDDDYRDFMFSWEGNDEADILDLQPLDDLLDDAGADPFEGLHDDTSLIDALPMDYMDPDADIRGPFIDADVANLWAYETGLTDLIENMWIDEQGWVYLELGESN